MAKRIIQIFLVLIFADCFNAAVIRKRDAVDDAKAEFERLAVAETEAFLNGMFRTQIDFFSKVKAELAPSTKRAQDITAYITRLEETVREKDLDKKDQMWRDTFTEFNKSPLLLNDKEETGLSLEEYRAILQKSGIEESVKSFLVEVATYFWKMAKASGKVIETTVEEYLSNFSKKDQF